MTDVPARIAKAAGIPEDQILSWAEVPERGELVVVDARFQKHRFPLAQAEPEPAPDKPVRGRRRAKRS